MSETWDIVTLQGIDYVRVEEKVRTAIRLQELVKERTKHKSKELCFGIPVDQGIRMELKSLVEESEK